MIRYECNVPELGLAPLESLWTWRVAAVSGVGIPLLRYEFCIWVNFSPSRRWRGAYGIAYFAVIFSLARILGVNNGSRGPMGENNLLLDLVSMK